MKLGHRRAKGRSASSLRREGKDKVSPLCHPCLVPPQLSLQRTKAWSQTAWPLGPRAPHPRLSHLCDRAHTFSRIPHGETFHRAGDIQGCGCGRHPGGVGPPGPFSERAVQGGHAGERPEPADPGFGA
ncbi:uncharacterized protein LOC114041538 isoform X2 [Vombatus ursinus]|uniref:uncharacterized protein LOC114041538 isoform X2 n=1 Tax=Vombatus ursinus TaxID=29139 RepID=UPI000FFDB365|nr:uncharacterized protein LOC114041538 isoform X2 [Vombatus ursinus]